MSNVVSLSQARARPASEPKPVAVAERSVEMALLLSILSALSVGNDSDRALFQLIGWEAARIGHGRNDAHFDAASALIAQIREANFGR